LSTADASPRRGEVWLVELDPTCGAEMQKTRPAVVISSDCIGRLPLRVVVPVTEWKEEFRNYQWMVRIEPSTGNGLGKVSAVDALQIRSLDLQRFVKPKGHVPASLIDEITAAVSTIIEHQ